MKLIAYGVCFFVLIPWAFAPGGTFDAFFDELGDLSDASGHFLHSFDQQPHVAAPPPPSPFSATSAYRPPVPPYEAQNAPGYPPQWSQAQSPAPPEWGHVQPSAPFAPGHHPDRGYAQSSAPANPFHHDQSWNSFYPPSSAPQQYTAQAPTHYAPFDPNPVEHWHDPVENRNPSDLAAVVYGNRGKSPVLDTGGTPQGPWVGADLAPPSEEPHQPDMRPVSHHGLIPGDDLLALSNRPFEIVYDPDEGLKELINKIKGFIKQPLSTPVDFSPFRRIEEEDIPKFYSSMYGYLRTKHIFRELFFEDKRYLISFLLRNRKLELRQLQRSTSIWEFEDKGTKTVMRCRGIYATNHQYWKNVEQGGWTGRYLVYSPQNEDNNPNILIIEKGNPGDLMSREARKLWTKKRQRASIKVNPEKVVEARSFIYQRQDNIQPTFTQWLGQNMHKTKWTPETNPEIQLGADHLQTFAADMRRVFRGRRHVHGVNIIQQPFFLTHHRIKSLPSLSNSFLALWKHVRDTGGGTMVALALHPMEESSFLSLLRKSGAQVYNFRIPHKEEAGDSQTGT